VRDKSNTPQVRSKKAVIDGVGLSLLQLLDGIEPFTRKRRRNESIREYWCRFLKDEDSDIFLNLGSRSKNILSYAGFNGR
jgi:hypothetical protein